MIEYAIFIEIDDKVYQKFIAPFPICNLLKNLSIFKILKSGNITIQLMQDNHEQEEDKTMEIVISFMDVIKQEQLHPNLLPYERELFDSIKEILTIQRAQLKQYLHYDNELEVTRSKKNFRYMIYNAEIEKIDYLLKMYLKMRLKKIQTYCFYLVKNQHEAEKCLSSAEFKFLKKYAQVRYQYYKDNIFKHFVKNYRDFKGMQAIFAKNEEIPRERKLFVDTKQSQIELKEPNLNEYVFALIVANPTQLRFAIDIPLANMASDEVISPGTIIYGPFRTIHQRFLLKDYKLI